MASLSTLVKKTKKALRRVGRGQGSKRGKTAGRGTKGQNSRAGRKKRPELRDFIKKLPKRRGHGKNRARGVNAERMIPVAITLAMLDKHFAAGSEVTLATLASHKLIPSRVGKKQRVKILATGTLSKKLAVSECVVSGGAKKAIEAAGGTCA